MPIHSLIDETGTTPSVKKIYLPRRPIILHFESKSACMGIDFANMTNPYQELHIGSSILSWSIKDVRIKLTKIAVREEPVTLWRNDYRIRMHLDGEIMCDFQDVQFPEDEYIKINGVLIDFDAMGLGDSICLRTQIRRDIILKASYGTTEPVGCRQTIDYHFHSIPPPNAKQ